MRKLGLSKLLKQLPSVLSIPLSALAIWLLEQLTEIHVKSYLIIIAKNPWHVVLIVILAVGFIFLLENKLQENSETTNRPPQQRLLGSVKSKLLEDVKSEVEGRLHRALHNAALIKLCKAEKTDQVKNPWDMEVKAGKKLSFQFEETSIIEVFDHSQIAGKLLILGAPGAGKTTTLLELASNLCDRAVDNPNEPIPVVFNLSAWKDDKQAIAD